MDESAIPMGKEVCNNNNNDIVKLQSCDGEIFEVETKVASTSDIIRRMMEDLGTHITIPLPLVSAKILRLVIQDCRYHVLDEPTVSLDAVKTWDEEFVRALIDDHATLFEVMKAANYQVVTNLLDTMCQTIADMLKGKTATLFEVTKAANYLVVTNLLDTMCQTIADMLKGKTAEQIRDLFNIRYHVPDGLTISLDTIKTWDVEFVGARVDDRATLVEVAKVANYVVVTNYC